jgi:uncharacterized repeat protein (TIGR01451 family)
MTSLCPGIVLSAIRFFDMIRKLYLLLLLSLGVVMMPAWSQPSVGQTISNQAQATYLNDAGEEFSALSNSVVSVVTQVSAFQLNTNNQFRRIAKGDQIVFQHTIKNTGNGPDQFLLSAQSAQLSNVLIYPDEDQNGKPDLGSAPISQTRVLQPGEVAYVVMVAVMPTDAETDARFTLQITARATATSQPATLQTNVDVAQAIDNGTAAVLRVTKALSRSLGAAGTGEEITVTVTYDNLGQREARDVEIVDIIGASTGRYNSSGFRYVTGSARWQSQSNQTLTDAENSEPSTAVDYAVVDQGAAKKLSFKLRSLPAGSQGIFTFRVTVDATAATGTSTTENGLAVSFTQIGSDGMPTQINQLGNNIVTYEVQRAGSDAIDLTVSKQHRGDSFFVGVVGRYQINVANVGQQPTTEPVQVVDALPASFMWVPEETKETAWQCAGAMRPDGGITVTCNYTPTIGGGQAAEPLVIGVRPTSAAQDTQQTNIATVSGGGEAAPEQGNNSGQDVVDVFPSATLSGEAWLDTNHDRIRQNEKSLVGYTVELLREGRVVAMTQTDDNGRYVIEGIRPGTGYQLRFREPVTGSAILGRPVDQGGSKADNTDGTLRYLELKAGDNFANQSLPLDPSGVVYDSVTRQPVKGATVTLQGPPGFVPSQHLIGGNNNVSQSTGDDGYYQFLLLAGAPSGVYTLQVDAATGYKAAPSLLIPANATLANDPCGNAANCLTPPTAASPYSVNRNPLNGGKAPQTGTDTTYYFRFNINVNSSPDVVDNHIPLDPNGAPSPNESNNLFVEKTANRSEASVGDVVDYKLALRNVSSVEMLGLKLEDDLPFGFVYVPGSARFVPEDGSKPVPITTTSSRNRLTFDLPQSLAPNAIATVVYRVRVGAGAQRGNGINTVFGTSSQGFRSNTASQKITVIGGVFADEGFVLGKIFVDCDGNGVQGKEEIGIPGVRFYLEDGSFVISDSEGKYSLYGLTPQTHVLKADATTLPQGSVLVATANRHAGDGNSRFIDLKKGELHRADFAEGSCSPEVLQQVQERRRLGEVFKAETDQRLGTRLETNATVATADNLKTLPATGVIGDNKADFSKFWQQAAAKPSNDPAALTTVKSSNRSLATAPAATLEEQLKALDNSLAFVGLNDGDTLPIDQIDLLVKAPLNSQLLILVNDETLPSRHLARKVEDSTRALMAWELLGINLKPGKNTLTLIAKDGFGNERGRRQVTVVAPANLAILKAFVAPRDVVADGRSTAEIRVQLRDAAGVPVTVRTPLTLEAAAGEWLEKDLNPDEPGTQVFMAGGEAVFKLQSPQEPGDVPVAISSGVLVSRISQSFLPELRPMLAVGLLEGTLRINNLGRGNVLPVRERDSFERELKLLSSERGGARAAMFLKGRVKGEYLLTLSYDSDKAVRDRLFRDIRPDEFYPVYGDASVRGYDAQSTGRFYIRVDHRKSFLLYGDFSTAPESDGRELTQYSRGLTGLKLHRDVGALKTNVFVANDSTKQVVDEFRANGTSGPFSLSKRGIFINSERVEIVTRDRNQPALVLSTQTLQRFVDYEVESFSGRLLFKSPVASVDQELNPRFIRVTYEVEQGGDKFWVYGADAQYQLTPNFSVGAMMARDENPLAPYQLVGANASYKVGENTRAILEVAQSDSLLLGTGMASRIEVRHDTGKVALQVRALDADESFENPTGGVTKGRQEIRVNAKLKLTSDTALASELLYSNDVAANTSRAGGLLNVIQRVGNTTELELGVRHVTQSGQGTENTPDINTIRARVNQELPWIGAAKIYAELEQDVNESAQRVAALGGDYSFQNRGRAYFRHELISTLQGQYALSDQQQRNATVVGIETDYLKQGRLFSEYRIRDALAQRDAEAAIGVRQNWDIAQGIRVGGSAERVHVFSGAAAGESIALTSQLDYSASEYWKGNARVEWRDGTDSNSWLASLAVAVKLERDWTLLGRTIYNLTQNNDGSERTLARGQIGVAYRDTDTNRWNGLARYERLYEQDSTSIALPIDRVADIVSLSANWQPARAWTFSGRLAGKLGRDRLADISTSTRSGLLSGRALWDVTERWDLGLMASTLVVQNAGQEYGLGAEAGYLVKANFWLSGGYNLFGFSEQDLAGGEYLDQGAYVRLRLKFDETAFDKASAHGVAP